MAQWVRVAVGERPRPSHVEIDTIPGSAGASLARLAHLVATCEAMARCGASHPQGRLRSARLSRQWYQRRRSSPVSRFTESAEASPRPPGSSQSQCRRRWAALPSPPRIWHGLRHRRRAGSAGRVALFATRGCWPKSGAELTMHSSLATRFTLSKSPMTAFTSAKQLRQACRAPSYPCSTVNRLPAFPGTPVPACARPRTVCCQF